MIKVAVENPHQEEIVALLRQSDAVAAALYPGAFRRAITPASLDAPEISLFVARIAGRAIGCCALFDRGDGSAEIKRMIVDEAHRGSGAGAALLATLEAEATRRGIQRLLLEVGIRNEAAYALYCRVGFTPCAAFAPYEADPISRFLAKSVSAQA
ncbi:MAG: GNAT family N-acetyltransferase [Roseomonas sp.]|nr:GNAT family N-acetyltransferase [Roseomonas sp.]MCA3290269.1 GNAT family N-acetyltransferase [Roseomonas sp.]MCA3295204.1 GNAT family N-acetyltransferase [Roseomonas sp.]